MNRKLNKDEIKISQKSIERLQEKIKDAQVGIDYAKRKLDFLKLKWEFEDFSRPLERKATEDQSNHTIEQLDNEILQATKQMEILNDQIKNGVESDQ